MWWCAAGWRAQIGDFDAMQRRTAHERLGQPDLMCVIIFPAAMLMAAMFFSSI
jgi:hypothetical protein